MTVPSASNKSGPYVLDGVASVFARTFLIVDADHLAIIRTENGVKTEITTGFIIDGVGNFTGNVTISPALTGGTVTLVRRVPNSQETDYSNQAKVAPAQVENDFDLVVMQIQDLAGQIEGIDAAILAADVAQAWAQSPTTPDPLDPTSKSSKTWAGEAAASAALVDLGALDNAVAATAADVLAADAARVLAESARDAVFAVALDQDLKDIAAITPSEGDLIFRNATAWVRLAKGAAGQVLRQNNGLTAPVWADAAPASATQDTVSGTQFDFTGVPAWVRKITVLVNAVSLTAGDIPIIQLGTIGGFVVTGYLSSIGSISSGGSASRMTSTAGFVVGNTAASEAGTVVLELYRAGATNTWIASVSGARSTGEAFAGGGGSLALGAALTQVRLTRTGASTFDGGSVSLIWE